jgi:hypothetical protein
MKDLASLRAWGSPCAGVQRSLVCVLLPDEPQVGSGVALHHAHTDSRCRRTTTPRFVAKELSLRTGLLRGSALT